MTESAQHAAILPPLAPRRWPRMGLMAVIFLSGLVVGAVAGRIVTHQQMVSMLKHPEQVADRVLPRIRSTLSLTDRQAQQVEEIVRRRHAAMEAVRSKSYPDLVAEFQALRHEVAEVLSPDQRERWQRLGDSVEQRYLPTPPAKSLK